MNESDSDIVERYRELRFQAPPLERVWSPDRSTPRVGRSRLVVVLAVAATLVLTTGAVAAVGTGALSQLLPNGICASGDLTCGSNYSVAGVQLDQTHNIRILTVVASPGLGRDDLLAIARRVAGDVSAPQGVAVEKGARVIVYVYAGLSSIDQIREFPPAPANDTDPAAAAPASLQSHWRLTYDRSATGERISWP